MQYDQFIKFIVKFSINKYKIIYNGSGYYEYFGRFESLNTLNYITVLINHHTIIRVIHFTSIKLCMNS